MKLWGVDNHVPCGLKSRKSWVQKEEWRRYAERSGVGETERERERERQVLCSILVIAHFCLSEHNFLPAAKRSLNFSSHSWQVYDIENMNLSNKVILDSQETLWSCRSLFFAAGRNLPVFWALSPHQPLKDLERLNLRIRTDWGLGAPQGFGAVRAPS